MEAYFLASGIKHQLDLFESIMQSQVFTLPFQKDGKDYEKPIYGVLAPIRLYKFVFPKQHLDEVVKMWDLDGNVYPQFNMQTLALRKLMKAKKFEKPKCDTAIRFKPQNLNLAVKGIGYKEDKDIEYNGYKHEGI
jgi:hypothetical protein